MWQGWVNLILGAWLILSTFVTALRTPANLIIVGILAVIFGFWTYKDWRGDVAGILGLWSFLCGVWFHIFSPVNFFIVGLVMAISGLWEGLSKHPTPRTT